MSATATYRQQHQDILLAARSLQAHLDPVSLAADPQPAYKALLSLASKLKLHLTMEDQLLYPRLLGDGQAAVRELAMQYRDEMGGIRGVFEAYLKDWADPEAVRQRAEAFRAATEGILDALFRRIDKEDNILYPLADGLG